MHVMRMAIAAALIGALAVSCAERRDDRMATSATGAAPAHPQPAYGAKVGRSTSSAATEDERLRESVRQRYGVPPGHPATPATPSHATAADNRLAERVKHTLASNKDTRALKLDVHAERGVVTLKGQAQTEAEKRKALAVARGVTGTKRVRDAITVAAPPRR
jgi:BON domain